MSASPPSLQFKSSNRTRCRKMEDYSRNRHFLCHSLYTKQPLLSSQHLKCGFLRRPSFSFMFHCLCLPVWLTGRLNQREAGTEVEQASPSLDPDGKLLTQQGDLERTLTVKSQAPVLHKSPARLLQTSGWKLKRASVWRFNQESNSYSHLKLNLKHVHATITKNHSGHQLRIHYDSAWSIIIWA